MQKGWYSSKCFKIIIYPKGNVSILRNIYTHFSQYFLPLKHAVALILTVVGTSHRKTLFKKKRKFTPQCQKNCDNKVESHFLHVKVIQRSAQLSQYFSRDCFHVIMKRQFAKTYENSCLKSHRQPRAVAYGSFLKYEYSSFHGGRNILLFFKCWLKQTLLFQREFLTHKKFLTK